MPKRRTSPVPLLDPVADGALFRFPIVGLFSVGMAASALGIARAAIDELLHLAGTKTPFGMASTLSTRTTTQIAVCEAMAMARSARALLVEETTRVWEMVQAGTPVTAEQRGAAADRSDTCDGGRGQRCRSHVHGGGRNSGFRL